MGNEDHRGGVLFPMGGNFGFYDEKTLRVLLPLGLMLYVGIAISGLLIWPCLIQTFKEQQALGEMSRQLLTCGGVGFVTSALICLAMSVFAQNYTVGDSYALGLSIGIVAVWIAMGVMNVNLITGLAESASNTVLQWIFRGLMGIVLAVVPAFVAAIFGMLVRLIGNLFMR